MFCGKLILLVILLNFSLKLVQSSTVDDTECTFASQFFCEQSKRCIPINWKCDGKVDCSINDKSDTSDEQNCSPKTCNENQHSCNIENKGQYVVAKCIDSNLLCNGVSDCTFGDDEDIDFCTRRQCKSTEFKCLQSVGACIPKEFVCDKNNDCPGNDRSDEHISACTNVTLKCDSDHRLCDNKDACINVKLWCDGSPDCDDGSDESSVNCPKKGCDATQFSCRTGNQCISNTWVCDGTFECHDNSDEENCTKSAQSANQTTCSNPDDIYCSQNFGAFSSSCIPKNFRCDGQPDCVNGEDEANCPSKKCQSGEFRCNDHSCVSGNAECDGNKDCPDGSDELTCPTVTAYCDVNNQFDCRTAGLMPYNRRCVPLDKMCDGKQDCFDGSDEKPFGSDVICKEKFKNSCANNNGGCAQICSNRIVNNPGAQSVTLTSCFCRPGFQLMRDGLNCEDVNECSIFGSCSQHCENFDGYSRCSCQEGYFLINRTCRAIGEKYLLHSTNADIREKRLSNGNMDPVQSHVRAVALDYSVRSSPRRIFYSDYHTSEIIMLETGPKQEKNAHRLAQVGINEGLAYDWVHQLLYYTDSQWKTISCINVTSGESVVIITTNVSEPRGITVNPLMGYIYWTDWGSPKIERAATDGSHRIVLFDQPSKVLWPNGITYDMATNRIFWTDAKLHAVASSTWDGADYRVIVGHKSGFIQHPFSLSVFEDDVYFSDWQRNTLTRCNKFTGAQCTDVKHGYQVLAVTVMHELRQPPASQNWCANHRCSNICLPRPRYQSTLSLSYSCACPRNLKLAADGKTCKRIENRPISPVNIKSIKAEKVKKPVGVTPSLSSLSESMPGKVRVGQLAGAVIGVLIGIVVISALLGALVYRNYMKRGIRSMNFDNPVYRKTTVDQSISIQHYKEYQPIVRESARFSSQNCALEHRATIEETIPVDSSSLAV